MSELKCSSKKVGEVVVMAYEGSIHMGGGDVVLRDTAKEQLAGGAKKVVIDLGKVSVIDSTGIGELVGLATSARRQSGEIRLANLTKKIKDLMDIVHLNTVFCCYDSVDDAVDSFKG